MTRRTAALSALALATGLGAGLAAPARAQDPLMAADQMLQALVPACQAGDGEACAVAQQIDAMAQTLQQATFYCQAGDPNACLVAQQAAAGIGQQAQMMGVMGGMGGMGGMAGMDPGLGAAPGYDPNNPLGATHADRMDAIAGFGAQSTQNFNDRMNQMDIQQQQTLDMINQ